jgi:Zn-dependent protease
MNLSLMFFNLIPIPPLDGSRVLPLFLSDKAMQTYHRAEQYGFIILFGVLWIAPKYLGFDPVSKYFSVTVEPLLRLFTGQG